MNTERKPTHKGSSSRSLVGSGFTSDELIEALELHLSPRTDPDHCDPCPYNPEPSPAGEGGPHAVDEVSLPQNTCQYRLMRDCLEALKQQKTQITMLEHSTMAAVKDFIEYFIDCSLPAQYAGTDEDYIIGETAFNLGVAFTKWQQLMEE